MCLRSRLWLCLPGTVGQTSEGTPQSTGWFEVQIVGGKLLHSKKVCVSVCGSMVWGQIVGEKSCIPKGCDVCLCLCVYRLVSGLMTLILFQGRRCVRENELQISSSFFRFLSSVAWTCDIHQKIMHYVCFMITLCDSSVHLRDLL